RPSALSSSTATPRADTRSGGGGDTRLYFTGALQSHAPSASRSCAEPFSGTRQAAVAEARDSRCQRAFAGLDTLLDISILNGPVSVKRGFPRADTGLSRRPNPGSSRNGCRRPAFGQACG